MYVHQYNLAPLARGDVKWGGWTGLLGEAGSLLARDLNSQPSYTRRDTVNVWYMQIIRERIVTDSASRLCVILGLPRLSSQQFHSFEAQD